MEDAEPAVGLAAAAAHPAPGSPAQTGGDHPGPTMPQAGAPSGTLCETSPAWDSPLGPPLSPRPFTFRDSQKGFFFFSSVNSYAPRVGLAGSGSTGLLMLLRE